MTSTATTSSDIVVKIEVLDLKETIQRNTISEEISPPPFIEEQKPIFPLYKVEEDPNCVAKQLFEIQPQKVTQFHINAVHNCYIPNVNGNWDNAETPISAVRIAENNEIEYIPNNSFNSVVPKYGSLINEHIPKDLNHVNFTKNFKPKTKSIAMEKLHSLPFLGVARCFQKRKKHKMRKYKNVKTDFASENILADKLIKGWIADDAEEETEFYGNYETDFNTVGVNNFITKIDTSLNNITKNYVKMASNKSLVLQDITIDVAYTHNLDIISTNTTALNKNTGRPNLLSIAEDINFTNSNLGTDNQFKELQILEKVDEIRSDNAMPVMASDISTMVKLKKPDESSLTDCITHSPKPTHDTSSRRSSNCSNSSLKQTQHSINLKLRRHRLQQQQEKIPDNDSPSRKNKKLSFVGKRRKNFKSENMFVNKKPRIQRIKIAINGGVATQREVSVGSSNNSTDDDEHEIENFEEGDNYEVNRAHGDGDKTLKSSCGELTSFTTIGEYNIVNDGDLDNAHEDIEEPQVEDDEDVEFDEDDEEEYSGEYHEVVTRDLSAPSADNNHIVLTIKKTPSKTNSPSNSLSAMSPVTATSTNLSGNTAPTITFKSTSINLSNVENTSNKTEDVCATTTEDRKCEDTLAKNVANCNSLLPKSLRPDGPHSFKRRKRRKVKKIKAFQMFNDSLTNTSKLHHQLFFTHELCVRTADGMKGNLINISSCSSSCAEKSEYEYHASTTDHDSDSIKAINIGEKHVPIVACNDENSSTDFSASLSCGNTNHQSWPIVSTSKTGKCLYITDEDENYEQNYLNDAKFNKEITHGATKFNIIESNSLNVSNSQEFDVTTTVETEPSDKNHQYQLPEENNGLLLSFNNIYYSTSSQVHSVKAKDKAATVNKVLTYDGVYYDDSAQHKQQLDEELKQQLPNENCDDYNNLNNNNNNFNLIKNNINKFNLENKNKCRSSFKPNSSNIGDPDDHVFNSEISKKMQETENLNAKPLLLPHKEYRTGLRAVDEDVDDEDGNNCARIQQFKEWHQVLQLRSYNDELLTVMPYVILD